MNNKSITKLLETVAFSNGCICSVELIRWEHTHFHPSGDPSPSNEDCLFTKNLKEASKLMNIQFVDHIIIGDHSFYSFGDDGRLEALS